jgi:hypothetical protein
MFDLFVDKFIGIYAILAVVQKFDYKRGSSLQLNSEKKVHKFVFFTAVTKFAA